MKPFAILVAVSAMCLAVASRAAEGPTPPDMVEMPVAKTDEFNVNLALATLGGKQFWSDEVILADWRIQRHALTSHFRLLDPKDVRHAWGTLDQCQAKLTEIQREKNLQPPRGKVVIALHGLLRSRHQLQGMCDYLAKEGGYTVVNFGYASSRAQVGDHAAQLAKVVAQCTEAEEIHFVGHSLGNIVVRHYLADCAAAGGKPDPRIKRIVMLGPPNNGAEMARRFQNNQLFQLVWGQSGQQLAQHWKELEGKLATPACEFGIIAGARGTAIGLNPLVAGDDDLVVSVKETMLPGASDFLTCPCTHGEMMDNPNVRKAVLSYLQGGYFVAADKKQPLPIETAQRK